MQGDFLMIFQNIAQTIFLTASLTSSFDDDDQHNTDDDGVSDDEDKFSSKVSLINWRGVKCWVETVCLSAQVSASVVCD